MENLQIRDVLFLDAARNFVNITVCKSLPFSSSPPPENGLRVHVYALPTPPPFSNMHAFLFQHLINRRFVDGNFGVMRVCYIISPGGGFVL